MKDLLKLIAVIVLMTAVLQFGAAYFDTKPEVTVWNLYWLG